jgi:hypothetical protein
MESEMISSTEGLMSAAYGLSDLVIGVRARGGSEAIALPFSLTTSSPSNIDGQQLATK